MNRVLHLYVPPYDMTDTVTLCGKHLDDRIKHKNEWVQRLDLEIGTDGYTLCDACMEIKPVAML